MSKSQRSYCFTSFAESAPKFGDRLRYLVYQREKAPTTGKLHWQGYAEFHDKLTVNTFKQQIGDNTAHIEIRRGNREEAKKYCMKSDTRVSGPYEIGDWNSGGQGSRNDLRMIARLAVQFDDVYLLDNHPEILFKYEKWISKVRQIEQQRKSREYMNTYLNAKLNEWQEKWIKYINDQNERQILWITDSQGGKGKTYLSKYLIAKKNAIRFTNGRTADISAAYNYEEIVIFDFARSCEERINYQIIEDLKNGMLFDSKYKSRTKYFKPPKVVIMANFDPMTEKLSSDRWVILNTSGNEIKKEKTPEITNEMLLSLLSPL